MTTDKRRDYGRRAWAPRSHSEFNPLLRKRGKETLGRIPGASLVSPPQFIPECQPDERAAALEALERMHRERPLRPPGR